MKKWWVHSNQLASEMLELFKRAFQKVFDEEGFKKEFDPAHPSRRGELVSQSDLATLYIEATLHAEELLKPNRFLLWTSLLGGLEYLNQNSHLEKLNGLEIKEAFNQWLKGQNLENVTVLDLSVWRLSDRFGQKLTVLPPEIGKLIGLERFSLRGNQLNELPPEIGKLRRLIGLSVDGNEFKVPFEIRGPSGLVRLPVGERSLTGLLKKMFDL